MKLKGMLILMICTAMLVSSFVGCSPADDNGATVTVPTHVTHPTVETDAPTEARLPEISGNTIRMYYDDRLLLEKLSGNEDSVVEISDQVAISNIVGSNTADADVICYSEERCALIAVGTGTARVTIDGIAYQVTVEAAPISLVMITGHSIGAGQTGVAAKSVLCEAGQAYSSYGVGIANGETDGVGIGFGAAKVPQDIYAFTSDGTGTIGEGSGLAHRWNQLTGEKIWVLNAAIGGSCLNEWIKGQNNFKNAVNLFRYAQNVLANEIAAGHYRLKDMAIIYHSAANFDYKKVSYTNELLEFWYDSMWNGFKEELSMDVNGDGNAETVQAIGFVPLWVNQVMHDDKPANYYMAASDTYPDMFMASIAGKTWLTDSGLEKNFPWIDYDTHGEAVEKPKSASLIFSDGVHYIQEAYNALGMDIAQNLYKYLRTANRPESFSLIKPDSNKLYDEVKIRVGGSIEIVPVVEPISVNDLTFTLSENLELSYPGIIRAKKAGTGTLIISHGNTVVKEITFTIID